MAFAYLFGDFDRETSSWFACALCAGDTIDPETLAKLGSLFNLSLDCPFTGCGGIWVGPKGGYVPPWSTSMARILGKAGYGDLTIFPLRFMRSGSECTLDPLLEDVWPDAMPPPPPNPLVPSSELLAIDEAQASSEHCRHHFFKGNMVMAYNDERVKSLWERVQKPLQALGDDKATTLLAFCDNASVIRGFDTTHFCLTAETHNYPSAIAPFPGGATGTGGRIRDVQACGRGAEPLMASVGYCVAGVDTKNEQVASNLEILLDGSTGAFDYGNKFGEPTTGGFVRMDGPRRYPDGSTRAWLKPIMFTAGVGTIDEKNVFKEPLAAGDVLLKLGGPVYRVGIGGGAASSKASTTKRADEANQAAVQRGDPGMEEKMNRVIRRLAAMDPNPIKSIHDQGAGGNANVLRELVDGLGADIDLGALTVGDSTLSYAELWIAEYQESNALACAPEFLALIQDVADAEEVDLCVVGHIRGDGRLRILYKDEVLVDTSVVKGEEEAPNPTFVLEKPLLLKKVSSIPTITDDDLFYKVLAHPDVGSKAFMTTKVDRTVGGRIVSQPCIGSLGLPLSDFAMAVLPSPDPNERRGVTSAIGEQPLKGLTDTSLIATYALAEVMTNLVLSSTPRSTVRLSANWMWPSPKTDPHEAYRMSETMDALVEGCKTLGIAIDGGKDSLSMQVGDTKAQPSLVLTAYGRVEDCRKAVFPVLPFGCVDTPYRLVLLEPAIDVCDDDKHAYHLGGSIAERVMTAGEDDYVLHDAVKPSLASLCTLYDFVQAHLGHAVAGHDRSDGGLWATLVEMLIGSSVGAHLHLEHVDDVYTFLFHEGPGLVLAVDEEGFEAMAASLPPLLKLFALGWTYPGSTTIELCYGAYGTPVKHWSLASLREAWHSVTGTLDRAMIPPRLARQEEDVVVAGLMPSPNDSFCHPDTPFLVLPNAPKVLVVREEGSNGDRELAAAFAYAGFSVDIAQTKALASTALSDYAGVAFCGGFSFSDVGGAAFGWAAHIRHTPAILDNLKAFYARGDTFSLGICNGCQLMVRLADIVGIEGVKNIKSNESGRFESRWVTLGVDGGDNSMWFKGMEGWRLGCWSAHGEGRFVPTTSCDAPLAYLDQDNEPTISYPFNPNGSRGGMAGVLSTNGRHLAMMPHPERSVLAFQTPAGSSYRSRASTDTFSPWIQLFRNAYDFAMRGVDAIHEPKVLVLGGGCREKAIEAALFRSRVSAKVVSVLTTPVEEDVDMVIVGPEAPLMDGVVDDMNMFVPCVGPSKAQARFEGSKLYMKKSVAPYIPTAAWVEVACLDEVEDALVANGDMPEDWVVKLDGLAGGKGVVLPSSLEDWHTTSKPILRGFWPQAGPVFLERRIQGQEVCIQAFCDGKTMVPMPPVIDKKRRHDGDVGPNTGGMGAVAFGHSHHPSFLSDELLDCMHGMMDTFVKTNAYTGFAAFQWMIDSANKPWLLEINCRLGDPETQAVLPLLDTDFYGVCQAIVTGTLDEIEVAWKDQVSVALVLVHKGYPFEKAAEEAIVGGIQEALSITPFVHVPSLCTSGGRFATLVGVGDSLDEARLIAYQAGDAILYPHKACRQDIGRLSPSIKSK